MFNAMSLAKVIIKRLVNLTLSVQHARPTLKNCWFAVYLPRIFYAGRSVSLFFFFFLSKHWVGRSIIFFFIFFLFIYFFFKKRIVCGMHKNVLPPQGGGNT